MVRCNFSAPQDFGMLCVCTSDSRSLCSAGIELVDAKGDRRVLYQNVEKGRKIEGLNFLRDYSFEPTFKDME